jgi:hypothetical protein
VTSFVAMIGPTPWPFLSPLVPSELMPSGMDYPADGNHQISAAYDDVTTLLNMGFTLTGVEGVAALWTPIDASAAGLTFTNVNTEYTKIGNMVFAYGRLSFPTTGDTNPVQIGGLPFAAAPNQFGGVPFLISNNSLSFGTYGLTSANSTIFSIRDNLTGASKTNTQMQNLALRFIIAYPVS